MASLSYTKDLPIQWIVFKLPAFTIQVKCANAVRK